MGKEILEDEIIFDKIVDADHVVENINALEEIIWAM